MSGKRLEALAGARREQDKQANCPCGGCIAWGETQFARKDDLSEIQAALFLHGIDTSQWGKDGYKTVKNLLWEVNQGEVELAVDSKTGNYTRFTRQLNIKIYTETTKKGECVLMVANEVDRWQVSHVKASKCITIRLHRNANWHAECATTIQDYLGLSREWQEEHLVMTGHTFKKERRHAYSYPGLATLYQIDEVQFRIPVPSMVPRGSIGLPYGVEFKTKLFRQQTGQTRELTWVWQPLTIQPQSVCDSEE